MRLALVHDYLAQDGGAERVLKAFHELWPEAPIFVLFHDKQRITDFEAADIRESFLAKFPFIKNHFQWYLPLMPLATEKHRLDDFDVVLSSTSAFAKGILTQPETLHISYCHTPPRYLWSEAHRYINDLPHPPVVKTILSRWLSKMRVWDQLSAQRVDHFIANSATVQSRIQKFYRRDSAVIYPPVQTSLFSPTNSLDTYYLAGGRLVSYKRLDLVIQAFNRLQYPLKIFGVGPDYKRLRSIAKKNIEFLGRVSETEKAALMGRAQAFIHPQYEDFGITQIEAMASGRPVIALNRGGATETIIHSTTGILFPEQSWESLYQAVRDFEKQTWDPAMIRQHSLRFDERHFKEAVSTAVTNAYHSFTAPSSAMRFESYAHRH